MTGVEILPLAGIPELREGDDLGSLVGDAIERAGGLEEGDVVVVAHKAVSKAEGRVAHVAPEGHTDAILAESARVRRRREDFVIAETHHGFVCASAGVDRSNTPGEGWVVLLPLDPDASARRLREALARRFGVAPSVIVTDTFGRAWRQGTTDVAIGLAGMTPLLDLRGQPDARGRELQGTVICVADELAGAAELVLGKSRQLPAALIRGYRVPEGEGQATDIVMPRERDLFP
jgi:coenzyme F420-0:L-glutamate ligase / coenzyme F420-1:gamma-L-glutamate ligase